MAALARFAAALAIAAAAGGALAGADIKPWKGKATLPLARNDLDGRAFDLKELQGRVLVVNFWATWCEPCRDEMPSMQELKRKLAGRPFEVLAVNLAESESKVADFVRRFPVDFTIPLDRNSAARRDWNVKVLPTSFVIAPDGSVRYSVVGELNWADDSAATGLVRLVPKQ